MPDEINDVPPYLFEVEITSFHPDPETVAHEVGALAELDEHLAGFAAEPLLAVLATRFYQDEDDEEPCDWGTFSLFLSEKRAWVHLMEGPCFRAVRPAEAGQADGPVRFWLDNGEWRDLPHRDTIPRDVGIEALRRWVLTGERLPDLEWREDGDAGEAASE